MPDEVALYSWNIAECDVKPQPTNVHKTSSTHYGICWRHVWKLHDRQTDWQKNNQGRRKYLLLSGFPGIRENQSKTKTNRSIMLSYGLLYSLCPNNGHVHVNTAQFKRVFAWFNDLNDSCYEPHSFTWNALLAKHQTSLHHHYMTQT